MAFGLHTGDLFRCGVRPRRVPVAGRLPDDGWRPALDPNGKAQADGGVPGRASAGTTAIFGYAQRLVGRRRRIPRVTGRLRNPRWGRPLVGARGAPANGDVRLQSALLPRRRALLDGGRAKRSQYG